MLEYHPAQCEKLRLHCTNGKSLESFCASIGVTPNTILQWYSDFPDFRETVEMAPCLELYYWEQRLLEAIERGDKDIIIVIKSRIDNLMKYVVSPIKKETYSNFKEDISTATKIQSSGDLIKDLEILLNNK
jgi:hypothetical protein